MTSLLSPEIAAWVERELGCGAMIRAVRELAGATSSRLFHCEVETNGGNTAVVLRRYTNGAWLVEEESVPFHEARNLGTASQAGVPTPRLLALDAEGDVDGVPMLLMSAVQGEVNLKPLDIESWLTQMAQVLAPLHRIDVPTYPHHYRSYVDIDKLQVMPWASKPELWKRAIDIVQTSKTDVKPCFIHRDYHPNNILWQDGRLSGIVDWPNACLGPAGIDVGWCRSNLAYSHGLEIADRYLYLCELYAGDTFTYDPHWDLMVAVEGLTEDAPDVYPGWTAHGLTGLTPQLMLERGETYLESVLKRF